MQAYCKEEKKTYAILCFDPRNMVITLHRSLKKEERDKKLLQNLVKIYVSNIMFLKIIIRTNIIINISS